MGFSYNRKLLSLALLGIILPMGLLTTFKLTGILKESPTITETTTLDVVRWSSEQIFCLINIGDMVKSQYDNGEISIVHSMDIYDYNDENWGGYFGSATLSTSVNLTATVKNGFVSKVYVSFREDYENSTVGLRLEKSLIKLENLSLINYGHWLDGNVKAFFDASNANSSSSVYLRLPAYWLLGRINKVNQTRLLEVTYEVTYFNGTTYKKIVQPFHLVMYPEDNDSFDTADAVTPGDYGMDPLLCLGGIDSQDFYKIYLDNGEIIRVTMTPPRGSGDFDLNLYSPTDRNIPVASSTQRGDVAESIDYNADTTGWWFIEVRYVGGLGFYTFTLTTSTT